MRDLIFISHCVPYPPDKGEKIRSYHLLKYLSARYRVHLGCLIDRTEDTPMLDHLRPLCASVAGFKIDRRRQKIKALLQARPGRPLMLDYYFHPGLRNWVTHTLRTWPVTLAFVYTVAMMPHMPAAHGPRMILDAVDIDSEKWTEYSATAGLPMRWIWAREGRTLLAYEKHVAARCDATLFVSPAEADRFLALAPALTNRVYAVENGVDLEQYHPTQGGMNPYDGIGRRLVFTGHMDYWPNVDAVTWFAAEVLPSLQTAYPGLSLHVVGANPVPEVRRLAERPGIFVTGRVPDVRPYVIHADVSVAPLRIARGIQNKVLEAMAMGRPVVASPQAFEGVRAVPGRDVLVADGATAFNRAVSAVLAGTYPGLGEAGRRAVEAGYAWSATLSRLDTILDSSLDDSVVEA